MRIRTLLLLSLLLLPGLALAQAGRFLLAVGDVAIARGATQIPAGSGTAVETGDTIRVGANSNAQIRLSDESIVSLRPNSVLRLDEYFWSGRADGREKSFFSLLKGGFRTVTGAIGRLHSKDKYQVRTSTSTIGIRGTHYVVVHCDNDCGDATRVSVALNEGNPSDAGLLAQLGTPGGSAIANGTYGGVSDGRIDVGNAAASKEFGANEFFYVANASSAPQGLIAPPGFLYDRLPGQGRRSGNQGSETVAAGGGAASESRSNELPTTLLPLGPIVTTQPPTPLLAAAQPTVAGLAGFTQPSDPGGNAQGGGFFTPEQLVLDGIGVGQKLLGFSLPGAMDASTDGGSASVNADSGGAANVISETTSNLLDAHWGRWIGGKFTNEHDEVTLFSGTNQLHYLYGPLTPPEVVAAKSGSFSLVDTGFGTFSNQSGNAGSFSMSGGNINFTTRVVSISSLSVSFPSESWIFSGISGPLHVAPGKGAFVDMTGAGICAGSPNCLGNPAATLGVTGIVMGPKGDHLGTSFNGKVPSVPALNMQGVRILTCAPACSN